VTYHGFEKRYCLSPSREALGKSLGRIAKRAFAKHSLQSEVMRKHLLARIYSIVRAEMKNIVKENTFAVKNISRETLTAHSWDSQYTALHRTAPVLLGFLNACIPRRSSRLQCSVATCIAVLVKSHCRSNLTHFLTSLILYSGHAAKQVLMQHMCMQMLMLFYMATGRSIQDYRNLVCVSQAPAQSSYLTLLEAIMII